MATVEEIRVFLASPGDVTAERRHAREVIEEINRTIGRERDARLEVIGWDTDAIPSYGADAQSLLNRQIADMTRYDLFIGIMWNRFGEPTPRAGSGTEEEFSRAVEAFNQTQRPDIMFYFSQARSNLTSEVELEQRTRVLAFKKRVRSGGMTWDYGGPRKFRDVFRRHISTWLLDWKKDASVASRPTSPAPGAEAGAGVNAAVEGQDAPDPLHPASAAPPPPRTYRKPARINTAFSAYEAGEEVIAFLDAGLRERARDLKDAGYTVSHVNREGKRGIRIENRGETLYFLDMWPGGTGDRDIAFGDGWGNPGVSRGMTATATPFQDRDGVVKLRVINFSLLPGSVAKDVLTRDDLLDAIWEKLVQTVEAQGRR